jgi:hypothetical protein
MISIKKAATALAQMKTRGLNKLERLNQLELKSSATPYCLDTHIRLFESALLISKLDNMKGII